MSSSPSASLAAALSLCFGATPASERQAAVSSAVWGRDAVWDTIVAPDLTDLPVLGKRARARVERLREEGTIAPFLREVHSTMGANGRARSTKQTYSSGERYFLEFCEVRTHLSANVTASATVADGFVLHVGDAH